MRLQRNACDPAALATVTGSGKRSGSEAAALALRDRCAGAVRLAMTRAATPWAEATALDAGFQWHGFNGHTAAAIATILGRCEPTSLTAPRRGGLPPESRHRLSASACTSNLSPTLGRWCSTTM